MTKIEGGPPVAEGGREKKPSSPRKFTKITDLKELGLVMDRRAKDAARLKIEEKFDRLLGGKFHFISSGNFVTNLPGIESILLIGPKSEGDKMKRISAEIFYKNRAGKLINESWRITEDGSFLGAIPKEIKLSREEISLEILRLIEEMDIGFWHRVNLKFLSGHDKREGGPHPPDPERRPGMPPRVDPARLAFLRGQKEALFGFIGKEYGFRGYYGAAFPTFIILENPRVDNAVFVIDLPDKINVTPEKLNLRPSERFTDEEVFRLLERYWPESLRPYTKKEARAIGVRIAHAPESWRKKIQEIIDNRTKPENAGHRNG